MYLHPSNDQAPKTGHIVRMEENYGKILENCVCFPKHPRRNCSTWPSSSFPPGFVCLFCF